MSRIIDKNDQINAQEVALRHSSPPLSRITVIKTIASGAIHGIKTFFEEVSNGFSKTYTALKTNAPKFSFFQQRKEIRDNESGGLILAKPTGKFKDV